MKITMTEYLILMDSLSGSLAIADGGYLYNYSNRTRKELWESLHERGNENILNIDEEEK